MRSDPGLHPIVWRALVATGRSHAWRRGYSRGGWPIG